MSRLEQLYYTWDRRNIENTGGLGILAHSAGWPALRPQALVQLKRRMQLYGEFIPGPDRHVGTRSLARYRVDDRYFLVRKTDAGADGAGRVANFVTHAVTGFGPGTSLDDLLALWDAPVPSHGLPDGIGPSRALPSVELVDPPGRSRRGRPSLSDELARTTVAALLAHPVHRRVVVLSGKDEGLVAGAVRQVVGAFRPGYADDLTFSTHELDPPASTVHVAGMVGSGEVFEQLRAPVLAAAALVVDVDTGEILAGRTDQFDHDLADLVLAGPPLPANGAPAELATLARRLEPWRLSAAKLDQLSGPEILTILASPAGAQWWAAAPAGNRVDLVGRAFEVDRERTVELLTMTGGPVDGDLRGYLVGSLARLADPGEAHRLGKLLRLDAGEHAHLDIRLWMVGGRAGLAPPVVAAAMLRTWGKLPLADIDELLADDVLGAALAHLTEFRGRPAVAVLRHALHPARRLPMRALVATALQERGDDLVTALVALLGECDPVRLAERLTDHAGSHVAQLAESLLATRLGTARPVLLELLRRGGSDPARLAQVLVRRRAETHEIFELPPELTAYIWPDQPPATAGRWARLLGRVGVR